jgi:hypothetical protein
VMSIGNTSMGDSDLANDLNLTSARLNAMDVNVLIYGGSNMLKIQKLDWNFLNSIKNDSLLENGRFFPNLCNATYVAARYLKNSSATTKFLITLPAQTPADEVDCLVCTNCSLNGIHSFTAKVFDEVDLSLVELAFGPFSSCSYVFENYSTAATNVQAWPDVLAAISDFICLSTSILPPPPPAFGANFSLDLLLTSRLTANQVRNFSTNISEIIERAFEFVSNITLIVEKDFDVRVLSFNNSKWGPKLPSTPFTQAMHTVLIDTMVFCKDLFYKEMLMIFARESAFAAYLNHSLYELFKGYGASTRVFRVNHVPLFNETLLNTTNITVPVLPSTTSPVVSINETVIPMYNTSYIFKAHHASSSLGSRIRKFFRGLALWMIILLAIAACLLCTILSCLCALCLRCCWMSYQSSKDECNNGNNINNNEDAPMIVTNQRTSNQQSRYVAQYGGNQYNKSNNVPEDDQVYV